MNENITNDTHDEDVRDILETVKVTKELLDNGEYDKVRDNLNHIEYICQYL